jgi:hypothetical protein
LFLEKVLTPDALKKAVDNIVRRGNQTEVLAAQKAPLAARVATLDRELANLTAAIASGSRPDVVLAAIAERDAERKSSRARSRTSRSRSAWPRTSTGAPRRSGYARS